MDIDIIVVFRQSPEQRAIDLSGHMYLKESYVNAT